MGRVINGYRNLYTVFVSIFICIWLYLYIIIIYILLICIEIFIDIYIYTYFWLSELRTNLFKTLKSYVSKPHVSQQHVFCGRSPMPYWEYIYIYTYIYIPVCTDSEYTYTYTYTYTPTCTFIHIDIYTYFDIMWSLGLCPWSWLMPKITWWNRAKPKHVSTHVWTSRISWCSWDLLISCAWCNWCAAVPQPQNSDVDMGPTICGCGRVARGHRWCSGNGSSTPIGATDHVVRSGRIEG